MKMICPCCKQEKEIEEGHLLFLKKCYDCNSLLTFGNISIPDGIIEDFIHNLNFGIYVEKKDFEDFICFLNTFNLKKHDKCPLSMKDLENKNRIVAYHNYNGDKEICYSTILSWSLESKHKVYNLEKQIMLN